MLLSKIYYIIYLTLFSISLLCDIYYILFNFTRFLFIFRCFHLFPIFSSFLFHFSPFIYFFSHFSFLLCFNWVYQVCYYFQFYLYSHFVNPLRRAPRPSELSEKPKSPNFSVVLFWSWASQFALVLPTLPSLSFYTESSNPETNQVPRGLSYSSTKRTLGTTLPEASRGSAIHIFLVKVSIYVSPAEEGHWIGFIINTTVVRCRWHHHYFVVVIVTKQHNNSCYVNHNSSPTRDRASPDNSFISLEKGDKATSEGSDRIKIELPLFFSPASAVLTYPYLVHLIRYKTFINNFPPTVSIRF